MTKFRKDSHNFAKSLDRNLLGILTLDRELSLSAAWWRPAIPPGLHDSILSALPFRSLDENETIPRP